MYNSHPSLPSFLSPSLPPLRSPSPSPPLPSLPLPSLPPSLPLVTQRIHCPFQPKQSPSIKQLSDRLASLSEYERKCVRYNSECRKPIVNLSMIAWLRSKRVRSDSPVCLARSPRRPINTTDSARPKRT